MASAAASSDYTILSEAASSNYTVSAEAAYLNSTANTFNISGLPRFSEYRSRVMLGDLPQDFLRIQLSPAQIYDPMEHGMRQAYLSLPTQQQLRQNPSFLGYFTLTIAEAKLIKSSGLLGLMKMDPYVTFRIGHVAHYTPIATGGGKNPQWQKSYRINLFKGMCRIHLEVYDQRNFTGDAFIGECEIVIPHEVMEGETRQHWFPLMGQAPNANENQGDILIIMSFESVSPRNQGSVPMSSVKPVINSGGNINSSTGNIATSLSAPADTMNEQQQLSPERSPSAIPKPPPPPYSSDDVRTIEEMFPTIDRRIITDLLDKHNGNKDLVVNQLLQNIA